MDDYARFVLERAKAGIRAPSQDSDRQAAPQRSVWQEQKQGRALNVQKTADLVEPEAVLKAKQKAAQDARFAARKAAKKKRRRGY
jgi:hypothetical protein